MVAFMFGIECASKLRKCGCSSFDVETINNECIQDIEVGTGQILLPYGMPDKQYQKEAVDITHQKCNTCMTSKVRGIFRPTQQSMITYEYSHPNKSS